MNIKLYSYIIVNKHKYKPRKYLWTKILVGVLGVTLSVVLHELFHILMHWSYITRVVFFPTLGTVVQIDTALPPGYDLDGEEIVAYFITLLTILLTFAIVLRIHDSEDKRSPGQIIFPNDSDMQKLNPTELLDLAEKADPGQVVFTPKRYKSKEPHK